MTEWESQDDLSLPVVESGSKPLLAKSPDAVARLAAAAIEAVVTPEFTRRIDRDDVLAVVALVPNDEWLQPITKAWKARFRSWVVVTRERSGYSRTADSGGSEVARALSLGKSVLGVAEEADMLPRALTTNADFVVELRLDASIIRRAIERFTNRKTPEPSGEYRKLDICVAASAFRPSWSPRQILRRIDSAACASSPPPDAKDLQRLEDAHQYGEAQTWALQLVEQVGAWRRNELDWSEVQNTCLFYGPPGTGKTTLAQIVAAALKIDNFVPGSMAACFSGGSSELGKAMKIARDINRTSPEAVIHWDELEALPRRDRLDGRAHSYWGPWVTGMMLDIEAAAREPGKIILASTNYVEQVDPALRRPGRFGRSIYIGHPDEQGIEAIARHHLRGELPGANLSQFALICLNRTAAEIAATVKDARRLARTAGRDLTLDDLINAALGEKDADPTELWRTCIHEAGHAALGVILGIGVLKSVKASMKGGSSGTTAFETTASIDTLDVIERRVVLLLAGRSAECVFFGEPGAGASGSDDSDLAKATKLLALAQMTGLGETIVYTGSADDALAAVRLNPALRAKVERHLRYLEQSTVSLVRAHRAPIEDIARQLAERRHLTGDQVRSLIFTHDTEGG
ncbi:AAA family ATPase [Rhodopseudomonas boonkerdii]|uniref:AAA family ATPase n=1 Tax=Rhodopseudomonas boonkerdii TaxID=475937 RepID=UPI001E567DCB|nr:AAA family ATPase [Rhodopseudomonas boonkerdii]UGV26993.1 AAA family ATPase [Rhodopseudomonas boonkerdii]